MNEGMLDVVLEIWLNGGWLMIPLALLGVFIYYVIFEIIIYLNSLLRSDDDTDTWGHWVDRPDDAQGLLGEMIQFVQHNLSDVSDIRRSVAELKQEHLSFVNRRLTFAAILVSTAPLTGLLGTVTGMLSTFAGLGQSTGETIDLVAGGISEALITTQTGLVLAIPGYILIHTAKRKRDKLVEFFNQLEILTIQKFERKKGVGAI